MGPVLGNAPSHAVATLRPNGHLTEKESLLITPARASATFSLSVRRKSKRRILWLHTTVISRAKIRKPRDRNA